MKCGKSSLAQLSRSTSGRNLTLRSRSDEIARRDIATEERPLFAFAGQWTPWRGVRGPKSAPVEGEHELFGFLTTDANAIVAPIHPKAMPVILTSAAEVDLWLAAETLDALALQRPLPDDALRIVAQGERSDSAPAIFPATV